MPRVPRHSVSASHSRIKMKQFSLVILTLTLSACTHLSARSDESRMRTELWNEGHMALYAENFARADSLFTRLAAEFARSEEGREAVFYLGTLRIDPRNREWSPERSEQALRQYLRQDTTGTRIHRRPEAMTLLELAKQLNMPPEERVAGLQPGTRVVQGPTRVVAPAGQQRELSEENERLRRQVAERDEQIRRQREELERIRRTLAPRS